MRENVPLWSLLVTYEIPADEGEPVRPPSATVDAAQAKYREVLEAADWLLLNHLRDWRRERARAEGIPPYLVVTNDVLAGVVRLRPRSLQRAGTGAGMGESKMKRFGAELLREMESWAPPPAAPHSPAPAEPPPSAEGSLDGAG